MTDEELREKVIKHDYEFKSLTNSLAELSDSMKQLTKGLEQVIVLNERMVSMDRDLNSMSCLITFSINSLSVISLNLHQF